MLSSQTLDLRISIRYDFCQGYYSSNVSNDFCLALSTPYTHHTLGTTTIDEPEIASVTIYNFCLPFSVRGVGLK